MRDLTKAIVSLYPLAFWELNGDDYSGLVWMSEGIEKPTEAQLIAECDRLQSEYESKQYQRQRAIAYPSIQEQLDMQYWDAINGTTTWQDAINAIKTQYPKVSQ